MTISKEIAVELASSHPGDLPLEGFKVIENEISSNSRWSIQYRLVVEKEGKYYQTYYSVGATESQDEGPFEYDKDPIEFREVFPKTITITVYES